MESRVEEANSACEKVIRSIEEGVVRALCIIGTTIIKSTNTVYDTAFMDCTVWYAIDYFTLVQSQSFKGVFFFYED